jgi:hypothetical protein
MNKLFYLSTIHGLGGSYPRGVRHLEHEAGMALAVGSCGTDHLLYYTYSLAPGLVDLICLCTGGVPHRRGG